MFPVAKELQVRILRRYKNAVRTEMDFPGTDLLPHWEKPWETLWQMRQILRDVAGTAPPGLKTELYRKLDHIEAVVTLWLSISQTLNAAFKQANEQIRRSTKDFKKLISSENWPRALQNAGLNPKILERLERLWLALG